MSEIVVIYRQRLMCGLCGILGGQQHWTETTRAPVLGSTMLGAAVSGAPGAGTQAAPAGQSHHKPPLLSHARRVERGHRVAIANRILRHYGLRISDWAGQGYQLGTFTGRTVLVDNLTQMWAAAENMQGQQCDPLDETLLASLKL